MLPNFHWIIGGVLAGMAQPGSSFSEPLDDLRELKQNGFSVIVSLTEKAFPLEALLASGLAPFHIPIDDFKAPTIEQAERFCSLVRRMEEQRRPVVVHCYAGLGRTGTMAAVYLMMRSRLSVKEALDELHEIEPGYIQSREQEEFLYRWQAHVGGMHVP